MLVDRDGHYMEVYQYVMLRPRKSQTRRICRGSFRSRGEGKRKVVCPEPERSTPLARLDDDTPWPPQALGGLVLGGGCHTTGPAVLTSRRRRCCDDAGCDIFQQRLITQIPTTTTAAIPVRTKRWEVMRSDERSTGTPCREPGGAHDQRRDKGLPRRWMGWQTQSNYFGRE